MTQKISPFSVDITVSATKGSDKEQKLNIKAENIEVEAIAFKFINPSLAQFKFEPSNTLYINPFDESHFMLTLHFEDNALIDRLCARLKGYPIENIDICMRAQDKNTKFSVENMSVYKYKQTVLHLYTNKKITTINN